MKTTQKLPVQREDDGELLGFIVGSGAAWAAQTVFGYTIAQATSQQEAEALVRARGLEYLGGVWQYYDEEDHDWHACSIKKAFEHQVTIVRTTPMGYQDPDDYKQVTLIDPTETNLVKS